MHEMFELVEQRLEQIIEGLMGEAHGLAKDYWDDHQRENKARPTSERGRVGPRVRLVGSTISISWAESIWLNDKKRSLSRHIKKGKRYKYRYSMESFRRVARDWELVLIEETEPYFEEIRRLARRITEAQVALRKLAAEMHIEVRRDGATRYEEEEDED